MRVLIFSHIYPGALSQARGVFVHNQARSLRDYGQMQVVAPVPWFPLPGFGVWSRYRSLPDRERMDGIEVLHPRRFALPRRILFTRLWRFYLAALQRGNATTPDLIHAHWAYPEGRAAVEYGRQYGIPVVITAHGSDIRVWPHLRPQWRAPTEEALRRADAVIAVSQDLHDRVLDFGVPRERTHLIPNGVDCRVFTEAPRRSPGADGWQLLFVGRFVREKGIAVLLEALSRVRRTHEDVSLTLIGGHPAVDDARPFRELAARLGLAHCVEFLDEIPWARLPEHMQRADLFILPSFSEGMPLVLLEAMASGLPLLSTRCGGPEEIIHPELGRLVDVDDPVSLSSALADMLEHYARYDRRVIRQHALDHYDHARIGARIAAVYRSVLDSRSS